MVLSLLRRKSYCSVLVGLIVLTLLTACGSNTSASTSSFPSSTSNSTSSSVSSAAATATALKSLMTLVGEPKAKLTMGTTFEVDGMVKNGDTKQHDIFLEATLYDASGKKLASAIENVDNVAGGATAAYAIQGTTLQSKWATVQVTVQKVTENSGGTGSD